MALRNRRGFARGDDGETSRGRNAEGEHRLADDVLAEHRPESGTAIAATRELGLPRSLQLNIDEPTGRRTMFTQQDGAAVTEHREVAVLMPGIRLRDRSAATWQFLTLPPISNFGTTMRDARGKMSRTKTPAPTMTNNTHANHNNNPRAGGRSGTSVVASGDVSITGVSGTTSTCRYRAYQNRTTHRDSRQITSTARRLGHSR